MEHIPFISGGYPPGTVFLAPWGDDSSANPHEPYLPDGSPAPDFMPRLSDASGRFNYLLPGSYGRVDACCHLEALVWAYVGELDCVGDLVEVVGVGVGSCRLRSLGLLTVSGCSLGAADVSAVRMVAEGTAFSGTALSSLRVSAFSARSCLFTACGGAMPPGRLSSSMLDAPSSATLEGFSGLLTDNMLHGEWGGDELVAAGNVPPAGDGLGRYGLPWRWMAQGPSGLSSGKGYRPHALTSDDPSLWGSWAYVGGTNALGRPLAGGSAAVSGGCLEYGLLEVMVLPPFCPSPSPCRGTQGVATLMDAGLLSSHRVLGAEGARLRACPARDVSSHAARLPLGPSRRGACDNRELVAVYGKALAPYMDGGRYMI